VREAAELEAGDTVPCGFLGLNAALCESYFIAKRRCAQAGLARVFDETENPFP
jgi:ribonucleoside-diphosphate reductase beta chain